MNWLAHTLLSKNNIDYQLGNILADPLKGRAWAGANKFLREGMKMHVAIDKFTDHHELIGNSKKRLGLDGHLKGVVLDLVFDHFLTNNWKLFCRLKLETYLELFNQNAKRAASDYPGRPKQIVMRLVETNLLGQYRTCEDILTALQRIDLRLSARAKTRETATQYMDAILAEYAALETDFLAFFPELINHFKSHSLGSENSHHLL